MEKHKGELQTLWLCNIVQMAKKKKSRKQTFEMSLPAACSWKGWVRLQQATVNCGNRKQLSGCSDGESWPGPCNRIKGWGEIKGKNRESYAEVKEKNMLEPKERSRNPVSKLFKVERDTKHSGWEATKDKQCKASMVVCNLMLLHLQLSSLNFNVTHYVSTQNSDVKRK